MNNTVCYLPITDKQNEVLEFIKVYLIDNQSTPTCAAIANRFGFRINSAYGHLESLRRKGFIEQISSGKKKTNYRLTGFSVALIEKGEG